VKVLRSRRLARMAGRVALMLGVVAMAAAAPASAQVRVTATLIQSHVVASWGGNWHGQLGDGTTTSRSRYGDIGAGNDVAQIAAGYDHGLAVRSDGTVWAWGDNRYGVLGGGTTTDPSTPVQVTGLTGVTQVAAGSLFSLALRSDGTVWAWGDNTHGELGRGTVTDHEVTPAQVPGLAGVTKISAGRLFGLALLSDGTVRAWGLNDFGQLGNGTTADSAVPVKVAGLSQVTGISAGWDSAVATQTSGISAVTSVWTWGGNDYGQLGDGTLTSHSTPGRVTGLTAYIAGITAGNGFAEALGTDGSVWGWGINDVGELGGGRSASPVTHPVNTIGAGSGITQLSAGVGHVLALKSDGTVLAWGYGAWGQLGNGSTASPAGPVQVTGLTSATQVAAGSESGYAVHVPLPTVPDLTGDTTAQAGQALQAAGLVLGTVRSVVDNSCSNIGTVMSQNPVAGSRVNLGSPVSITIGTRPPHLCP
jgi:alpha-tubulin suppressor-like RCC1 family protein